MHHRVVGRVIFIGAGPGAADLITVRGAQRLALADVVLFDALTDPALREHAPQAQWIDVGKRGFGHAAVQADIDRLLVDLARQHAVVVRLKGGDPGIFGRLEEELATLRQAGVDCEVVPGISAAQAAAAVLQRPLTRRGSGRSLALVTAMSREGPNATWRHADTEVFYMAGQQLPTLAQRLIGQGWPVGTPVCVVSRAGWPDQRVTDHRLDALADAAPAHAGRPTVVVLGAGATPVTADAAVGVADAQHKDRLPEKPQDSV